MKWMALLGFLLLLAPPAHAQIQVDLKLKRLQYVAYEPIVAKLTVTNLAGRDVELRDDAGQHWFGFEVTGRDAQTIAPSSPLPSEPPLNVQSGQTVSREVNLTQFYPVSDLGIYHLRANIYFADLSKYFYSTAKVFEVTNARPIWQKTVGVPDGGPDAGGVRTYSLLTNRFADHTSLYIRVEDKNSGAVYTTYSLGRLIAMDDPQAEVDRANQLHVLQCSAPLTWTYSHIGLDGKLLKRETFMEAKTRPRLIHTSDGAIAVAGGLLDNPVAKLGWPHAPKLSARPAAPPSQD